MPNDKLKLLYESVSQDYDVGSFDDFSLKLSDPTKRKAFYDGVGKEYQLGSFDEFDQKISGIGEEKKKPLQEPSPPLVPGQNDFGSIGSRLSPPSSPTSPLLSNSKSATTVKIKPGIITEDSAPNNDSIRVKSISDFNKKYKTDYNTLVEFTTKLPDESTKNYFEDIKKNFGIKEQATRLAMQKKYGNPSVEFDPSVGISHFNALTNRMILSDFNHYIQELSHSKQNQKGEISVNRVISDFFKSPYINSETYHQGIPSLGIKGQYDTPGTIEHDAHTRDTEIWDEYDSLMHSKYPIYSGTNKNDSTKTSKDFSLNTGFATEKKDATNKVTIIPQLKYEKATPGEYAQSIDEIVVNAINRGIAQGEQANALTAARGIADETGVVVDGPTPRDIATISNTERRKQYYPTSEEYAEFNNAPDFSSALLTFVKNPVKIFTELSLESLSALAKHGLPRMAAGAAIGSVAGLPGAGTGMVAGLGVSSLNLEYSSKMLEALADNKVDISDPKQLSHAFEDKELISKIRSDALKKGVPIALFDMVSAGLAGRTVAKPAKTLIKKALQVASEVGTQSALGGGGELAGEVVSGEDINAPAILGEMVGEMGGAHKIATGYLFQKAKSGTLETKDVVASVLEHKDNPQDFVDKVDLAEHSGEINPEAADEIKNEASKVIEVDSKIPDEVTDPKVRGNIIGLIADRNGIDEQIKYEEDRMLTLDESFLPQSEDKIKELKNQRDQINEQIKEQTKATENIPADIPENGIDLSSETLKTPEITLKDQLIKGGKAVVDEAEVKTEGEINPYKDVDTTHKALENLYPEEKSHTELVVKEHIESGKAHKVIEVVSQSHEFTPEDHTIVDSAIKEDGFKGDKGTYLAEQVKNAATSKPFNKNLKAIIDKILSKVRKIVLGILLTSGVILGGKEVTSTPTINDFISKNINADIANIVQKPLSDISEIGGSAIDKFLKIGEYADAESTLSEVPSKSENTKKREEPIRLGESTSKPDAEYETRPYQLDLKGGEVKVDLADNLHKRGRIKYEENDNSYGIMGSTRGVSHFSEITPYQKSIGAQVVYDTKSKSLTVKPNSEIKPQDEVFSAPSQEEVLFIDDLDISEKPDGSFDIKKGIDKENGTAILKTKNGGTFHIGWGDDKKTPNVENTKNLKEFKILRGGMVWIYASDGSVGTAVSGSVKDIFDTYKKLKDKNPDKKFIMYRGDTGTYGTPSFTKNGKTTEADVRKYSNRNTYGQNVHLVLLKNDSSKNKSQDTLPVKEQSLPILLALALAKRKKKTSESLTHQDKIRIVSEAYHAAKKDGSNPELVAEMEKALGKPKEIASNGDTGKNGEVQTEVDQREEVLKSPVDNATELTESEKTNLEKIASILKDNFRVIQNIYIKYGEGKPLSDITIDDFKKALAIRSENAPKRKFIQTVQSSDKTTAQLNKEVKELNQFYDVFTNKAAINSADKIISKNIDKAKETVISKAPPNAEKSALAIRLIKHYEKNYQYDQAIDVLESYDNQLREAGRFIQAASLWNKLAPETIVRVAKKEIPKIDKEILEQVYKRTSDINKMSEGIEKDKAIIEVLNLIADQKPLTLGEKFDAFRYQNMLSSPKSHMRNIHGNLFNVFVTRPTELVGEATADFFNHIDNPADRSVKFSQVPQYYKDVFKVIPEAIIGFREAVKHATASDKILDLGKTDKMIEALRKSKLPKGFTVIPRLMEAEDRFFSILIAAGEKVRLMKNGMDVDKATLESQRLANEYLYRQKFEPNNKTNSAFIRALDGLGQSLNKLRDIPYIGKSIGWFMPFVKTPINLAKQQFKFSPLGFIGGDYSKGQIAPASIGSTMMAVGAVMAIQGLTTWGVPKDKDERDKFFASGRKPYSIKIGEAWVPIAYFGPLALSLALPAAAKYFHSDSKNALTDNEAEEMAQAIQSVVKYFLHDLPVEGIEGFYGLISGSDETDLGKELGRAATQLIPASGMIRYINNALDPIYRKTHGFLESIESGLPELSKDLEPHTIKSGSKEGQPSTRIGENMFFPYDIGITNEEYEILLQNRKKDIQNSEFEKDNPSPFDIEPEQYNQEK